MQLIRPCHYFGFAAIVFLFVTLSGIAHAQNSISLRAGSFSPWRGNTGTSATFQYTHQLGLRHHLGAEFAYRNFEGGVADVKNIELEQYVLRVFYRADLVLDSPVMPYLGLGFGPGVNVFDRNPVEQVVNRRNPGSDFDIKSAAVLDLTGVVGVDVAVPRTEWLSLFGEARFNYTAQFTSYTDRSISRPLSFSPPKTDKNTTDHTGGVSVHGGVRFFF